MSIKSIAAMITRMDEWIPNEATAANFEVTSLFGPLCRLGVFLPEWVGFVVFSEDFPCLICAIQSKVASTYFSEPEKRTRDDIESTYASLRATLKTLQVRTADYFGVI